MKKIERYTIIFNGLEGVLDYDDSSPVQFSVEHPDPKAVELVRSHFLTPREFRVPESSQIDDYRIDFVEPTRDINYFTQALCELHAATDVDIVWGVRKIRRAKKGKPTPRG
jgi:hypothetical protein